MEETIKQEEMKARMDEVEGLFARRLTVVEIAKRLKVSERTVNRDIAAIRKKNLQIFQGKIAAKKWVKEEWVRTVSSLNEAEKEFWHQVEEFKNEPTKNRALWCVVQTISLKKDVLTSIADIYGKRSSALSAPGSEDFTLS